MEAHVNQPNPPYSSLISVPWREDVMSTAASGFFQADSDLGVESLCSTLATAASENDWLLSARVFLYTR